MQHVLTPSHTFSHLLTPSHTFRQVPLVPVAELENLHDTIVYFNDDGSPRKYGHMTAW